MDYGFKVLTRTRAFDRHFKIDVLTVEHELFAGGWSRALDRELIDRGDAVGVIPYDPWRDEVLMVEQFRVGTLNGGASPWLLEFVAGLVDEGEAPVEVARREAEEEGALHLLELEKVGVYWMSPGGSTERLHLFCGCVRAPASGSLHGLATEGEDIKLHVFDLNAALELLEGERVLPAWTALALHWLGANAPRLRRDWAAD